MIANMNMNYLVSGRVAAALRQCAREHRAVSGVRRRGRAVRARGRQRQSVREVLRGGAAATFHQDARFAKNADRVRHREALVPLLAEVLRKRSVGEWVQLLEPLGVPVGPINDLAQVFEHPQVREPRHAVRSAASVWRARCRASAIRSACPARRSTIDRRRRLWDSIRRRCWPNAVWEVSTWRGWPKAAWCEGSRRLASGALRTRSGATQSAVVGRATSFRPQTVDRRS